MSGGVPSRLSALVALAVLVPGLPALIVLMRRGRRRGGGGMAAAFSALEQMLDPSRQHVVAAKRQVAQLRTKDEPLDEV